MGIPTKVSTEHGSISKTGVNSLYVIESLQPNLIYKIEKNLLLTYFICVRKSHFIIFHTSELVFNKYIIYDGPGILSPVLRIKNFQKHQVFNAQFS